MSHETLVACEFLTDAILRKYDPLGYAETHWNGKTIAEARAAIRRLEQAGLIRRSHPSASLSVCTHKKRHKLDAIARGDGAGQAMPDPKLATALSEAMATPISKRVRGWMRAIARANDVPYAQLYGYLYRRHNHS